MGFTARIGLSALSVAMVGCVAYRGGNVPTIDRQAIAVPRMERVIVYDLRVESQTGGDLDVRKMLVNELEASLRAAGAELKPSGQPGADYDMTVEFDARGSVLGQALSGFISGLSFMVLPAYAGVDLSLDAAVTAADGAVHRYRYEDRYTLWIQLFLLPFSTNPDRVAEELIADMTRCLARDMQRDGLLPAPGAAAAPSTAEAHPPEPRVLHAGGAAPH